MGNCNQKEIDNAYLQQIREVDRKIDHIQKENDELEAQIQKFKKAADSLKPTLGTIKSGNLELHKTVQSRFVNIESQFSLLQQNSDNMIQQNQQLVQMLKEQYQKENQLKQDLKQKEVKIKQMEIKQQNLDQIIQQRNKDKKISLIKNNQNGLKQDNILNYQMHTEDSFNNKQCISARGDQVPQMQQDMPPDNTNRDNNPQKINEQWNGYINKDDDESMSLRPPTVTNRTTNRQILDKSQIKLGLNDEHNDDNNIQQNQNSQQIVNQNQINIDIDINSNNNNVQQNVNNNNNFGLQQNQQQQQQQFQQQQYQQQQNSFSQKIDQNQLLQDQNIKKVYENVKNAIFNKQQQDIQDNEQIGI